MTPNELREQAARIVFLSILVCFCILVFFYGGFDAYPRAIFEAGIIVLISALVMLHSLSTSRLIWSSFDLAAIVLTLLLIVSTAFSALPGISLQEGISLFAVLCIITATNRIHHYRYIYQGFGIKIKHEEAIGLLAMILGIGLIFIELKTGSSNRGLEFLSDFRHSFININHNTAFLSLAVFCGLYLLLKYNKPAIILSSAYLLLVLISFMIAGGSSGATFAFFGSFLIMALITYHRKDKKSKNQELRLKINLIYILPVLALFVVAVFSIYRGREIFNPQQQLASLNTKAIVWAASTKALTGNLLFGNGPGTFRYIITKYLPTSLSRTPYYAESDFMHLLFENGLIFTLFFSLVVIAIIMFSLKRKSRVHFNDYRLFFSCGILAMMIHGLVDIPIHVPALMWFFAIILGLLLPRNFNSFNLTGRSKAALLLVLGFVCVVTLYIKGAESIGSIYFAWATSEDTPDLSLLEKAVDWDPHKDSYVFAVVDNLVEGDSVLPEDVGRGLYLVNRALGHNPLNHRLWALKAKLGAASAKFMSRAGMPIESTELDSFAEAFNRAIALYPANTAYTLERASFFANMGQTAQALRDIKTVFDHQPTWWPRIIKEMVDSGYDDETIIETIGNNSLYYIELGKQRKTVEDDGHSIALYQQAFTAAVGEGNFDNAVQAIKLLLGCKSFRNNVTLATTYLERAHFYHPEIWNVSLALGELYLKQNEREKALALFLSCTLQKNNWQCPFSSAKLLIEIGRRKEAFDQLLTVIEHPKTPPAVKIKAEEMRQRIKYLLP